MFATANIRNQNALKNERHHYFWSQRMSLLPCEIFAWLIYACALVCLTAVGIDFLFTEFSFWYCSSWDFWFWLTSAKQLSEAPIYLCREMKKTTVAFKILKSNVWVNTALEENHHWSHCQWTYSLLFIQSRGIFPVSLATSKHKTCMSLQENGRIQTSLEHWYFCTWSTELFICKKTFKCTLRKQPCAWWLY